MSDVEQTSVESAEAGGSSTSADASSLSSSSRMIDELASTRLDRYVLTMMATLGEQLRALGQLDEAERLERAQQRVVHLREDYGPGTHEVAGAQIMVMRALLALDRPAEALRVGEQALADLDVEVAVAGLWPLHQMIGRAELTLGHEDRAILALEQALAALQREQGLTLEQEALSLELLRLRAD
jgi:hypothetical protein